MTIRVAAILALTVFFAMMAAAQTTLMPAPAPGVTHVIVDNEPVAASVRQAGPWSVASTRTSPALAGHRYAFVWPDGERNIHVVTRVRDDGWVQVDAAARWVNTAMAVSIEDVQ